MNLCVFFSNETKVSICILDNTGCPTFRVYSLRLANISSWETLSVLALFYYELIVACCRERLDLMERMEAQETWEIW